MTTLSYKEKWALAEEAIAESKKAEVSDGWDHVDALCLPIQNRLGVETGDVAGYFWSGREDEWDDDSTVVSYIEMELFYIGKGNENEDA